MNTSAAKELVRETLQSPFDKEQFYRFVKELLNHLEDAHFLYRGNLIPDAYAPFIQTLERLGKYRDPEDNAVDILIVKLKKESSLEHARTMQRNFVAWYLSGSRGDILKDAALVAFVAPDPQDWRFSLVKMEYKITETPSGKVKAKEEFTPAKRYSFIVGQNETTHTAQSRLVPILEDDAHDPTLERLGEAFNIERVTEEFFEKYRELYLKVKETIDALVEKDAAIKKDFEAKAVNTVDFSKKLLGQIVFLYFLQKKGWFGVKRGETWGAGSKRFLRELFERKHGNYQNFFNDILEPLFYEALRLERPDDYYSRFDCRIPFLNGGLFDPLNNYDWVETDITISNEFFSNSIQNPKTGDIGTGILDIFDRYNFTVKEDEPLEKEVAVDPEMLGKVFENLLAVADRKSKGTYYTPREIVHYMCQESLMSYLATETEKKVKRRDIETLIKYGETAVEHDNRIVRKGKETKAYSYKLPESIRKNAQLIDEKLTNIRVCDLAVGSGAFPVGMMSEIIRARNALTPHLKEKDGRAMYDFKRQAIQNCLYGVDIDPSAVEIAKLRLWLSLVVDEEDIKQIKPLPNLDYKIVRGNSLLSVEKTLFNKPLFEKLEVLKPLFFNETNTRKKQEYKKQIDELINQITRGRKDFDFEVYFSEVFHNQGGFGVVIGNPPYVRQEEIKDQKPILQKQNYEVYNATSDLYTYFYEKSFNILKDGGVLTFISSNKWMRAKYGEKLRRFFSEKTKIIQLIDFNGHKVFEATVDTNIIILQKEHVSEQHEVSFVNIQSDFRGDNLVEYLSEHQQSIKLKYLNSSGWSLISKKVLKIKEKIERVGTPLKDWEVKIYRGIITGFNEAFIIDMSTKEQLCNEDPKSSEILKPILRGRDIDRYYYNYRGLWLIKIESGWTDKHRNNEQPEKFFRTAYPAIYRYFLKVEQRIKKEKLQTKGKGLRNRDDQGRYWWELRDCDYYQEFEKEKIIWPVIGSGSTFAYDTKGFYNNDKAFSLVGNSLKFVLALLNSRLSYWYLLQIGSRLGSEGFEFRKIYTEQLPIRKVPQLEQEPFTDLVDKILSTTKDNDYLKNSTKQAEVRNYEKQIDQLVYKLYGLTPEEIKIVENKK